MTQSIIEKKHQWGEGGGGGEEKNDKFKLLGGRYTKRANSVHGLCNLLSFHCQRGGKNMGGVGHSRPTNETIVVCRVIGNVHTAASVYWYVVGEVIELCMLGVYTHVGGEKCYLVCWVSNIEF